MAKWKKQYLRAFCAAMLVIMTFAFCVGCAGEKKYDVSIKVVNNYGDEWIFTPDVDELYYEFRYTGEEMTFGVDSYYVYGEPRFGDRWLDCSGVAINYFSGSWGYQNPEGKTESVHSVSERGDYCYTIYTRQNSWNRRTVRLYITVK